LASKSSKKRRKRRRAQQRNAAAAPGTEAAEGSADTAEPAARAVAKQGPRRAERNADDERPPAPWGSFPLIELTVLIGIVMLVIGLIMGAGERGVLFVITGLALASIGGLELAIREHFAGYRSHTMILAGVPAAIVLAVLFFAGPESLPPIARAGIAAVVYAGAAALLVRIFRNRSGGRSFRFSSLTGR
jgi:peptidoglycan/LPS O-acetylase OafA/YrhL